MASHRCGSTAARPLATPARTASVLRFDEQHFELKSNVDGVRTEPYQLSMTSFERRHGESILEAKSDTPRR